MENNQGSTGPVGPVGAIVQLPIDSLNLRKFTPEISSLPRYSKESIDQLAESLREDGLREPVPINKNGVVLYGFRRYLAAKSLGWHTIMCKVVSKDDSVQAGFVRRC